MYESLISYLKYIVFSPKCLLCKSSNFVDNILCHSCWPKITFISNHAICLRCGAPKEINDNDTCMQCYKRQKYISLARAAILFDEHSSSLIYDFKYNDNIKAKNTFAKWMINISHDITKNIDFICPIPISKRKLKIRKYNQSLVLAKEIAKLKNIRLIPDLLIRVKELTSQTSFSQKDRARSIKNSFQLNTKYSYLIKQKSILLIDDVITTGATSSECAKVLLASDVYKINLLTLAKTLRQF